MEKLPTVYKKSCKQLNKFNADVFLYISLNFWSGLFHVISCKLFNMVFFSRLTTKLSFVANIERVKSNQRLHG